MPTESTESRDSTSQLRLVRRTLARELDPLTLPGDQEDLSRAGLVDSMTRVNILLALEEVTGIPGLSTSWPDDRPFSVRELASHISEAAAGPRETVRAEEVHANGNEAFEVSVAGWGVSPGSTVVTAEDVDRECGFSPGFLRDRTGIESLRRAPNDESEISLAARAAQSALENAQLSPDDIDLLVAVSTTFLGFPSFAATLHAHLLLQESAGAIDVGGACSGVIYGLAAAKALLPAVNGRAALVVASEVNSRRLLGIDSPPEFRALFGDAACAFVLKLRAAGDGDARPGKRLRDFVWGCSSTFASALRLSWPSVGTPAVQFKGEQLAGAAITQLERVIDRLTVMAAIDLAEVDRFALHEPNPRVLALFCQKAGIPVEKVPQTSKTWGNLGSATCGVNLCKALSETDPMRERSRPATVLAAAVGPGLLWGGACIG
ncbi:MAG TPA: 3-oxoacyl-[acyl-carrier-protein] synthase III C-terminal domain-containing protein [Terriglobia bacterium]|nr:3-oxoacyl-[acyl-carrier-protein] synthase III C-terminal domain-containing protein [Terriglobia bacterium]